MPKVIVGENRVQGADCMVNLCDGPTVWWELSIMYVMGECRGTLISLSLTAKSF